MCDGIIASFLKVLLWKCANLKVRFANLSSKIYKGNCTKQDHCYCFASKSKVSDFVLLCFVRNAEEFSSCAGGAGENGHSRAREGLPVQTGQLCRPGLSTKVGGAPHLGSKKNQCDV